MVGASRRATSLFFRFDRNSFKKIGYLYEGNVFRNNAINQSVMEKSLTRFLTLTIILCFGATTLLANEVKISGRLLFSRDSTAVIGASVRLLDLEGTTISGTTTNEKGDFTVTGNESKESRLEISFVGHVPISVQIEGGKGSISLGDLYLVEDSKQLGEVTVTGSLRQYNRQLVFPEKLQIRGSHDFMTLLHNLGLTGLSVDQVNKNASINGKPIQWKINGVPRSVAEVRNLKPESILRVDYSDMPTMRELDQGFGGIIDVILKERTDGGSVRSHLQSALWVGFVNGSASASYHQGKSDFSIDYNTSYRNYPKWQKDSEEKFIADSKEITRILQGEASPFGYFTNDLNFTYLYQPSKVSQFSATWRNSFARQYNNIRGQIIETDKDPYHRASKSKYRGYVPALDLFYQHQFGDGSKLEANLLGTLSTGRNDRDLVDTRNGAEVAKISNPVESKYKSLIGEVMYQKSLHPKVYLTTGLQNRYAFTTNEYLSPSSYLDQLQQNNTYLYAQISGRLNPKVQYSLGSGLKFFYVESKEKSKKYFKNQSSLGFYYNPNNRLSFSLNSNFIPFLPSLAQLSSVKQRFDRLTVFTGNSELKSSYAFTNRLNMNYRKDKFNTNLALSYNHTTHPLYTRVTYLPEEEYFLFQSDNGLYNRQYGAEWKVNFSNLMNFLSLYTTVGYKRYESNVGNHPLHLNSLYWDISAQVVYKELVFAGYYTKVGKTLYNETEQLSGDNMGLTLMWNKNNWTLYAQMLYVGFKEGDTYRTTNHSKVNPLKSYVKIPENGNMLTLGVVWNLDFGKRVNRMRRGLKNYDSNNSVVKVQD